MKKIITIIIATILTIACNKEERKNDYIVLDLSEPDGFSLPLVIYYDSCITLSCREYPQKQGILTNKVSFCVLDSFINHYFKNFNNEDLIERMNNYFYTNKKFQDDSLVYSYYIDREINNSIIDTFFDKLFINNVD